MSVVADEPCRTMVADAGRPGRLEEQDERLALALYPYLLDGYLLPLPTGTAEQTNSVERDEVDEDTRDPEMSLMRDPPVSIVAQALRKSPSARPTGHGADEAGVVTSSCAVGSADIFLSSVSVSIPARR